MTWNLNPSPLESARFGIRAGKLTVSDPTSIPAVLDKAKELDLNFISTRVDSKNIALVQQLEKVGFFLTDTLIYYRKHITNKNIQGFSARPYIVRLANEGDFQQITEVAALAFKGYIGHYHSDPNLSSTKADQVYVDWIRKSCYEKFLSDAIYVTEENGDITSFATVKKNAAIAEGVLFGVHPHHQGKGIYRELISASMQWALENSCTEVQYSTQIGNIAVQKVWTREGCEINGSYYTLHGWIS